MAVDLTDVREGDEITLTIDLLVKLVDRDCTHTIECEDAEGNEYYFDQGDPGELVIKPRPFTPPPAGTVWRQTGGALALSFGDEGYIYLSDSEGGVMLSLVDKTQTVWPWTGVEHAIAEIIVNGASE